jgi:hypothetical protein
LNIKSLHRKQVRIGRLNYRKKAIEKEIDSINNIKEKRELYQKFKEFFNREFLLEIYLSSQKHNKTIL